MSCVSVTTATEAGGARCAKDSVMMILAVRTQCPAQIWPRTIGATAKGDTSVSSGIASLPFAAAKKKKKQQITKTNSDHGVTFLSTSLWFIVKLVPV